MAHAVFATTNGYITPVVQLRRGEAWDPDDPIVAEHPEHFTDNPAEHGLLRRTPNVPTRPPAIEEATAAPGEKRTRTTPRG